MITPVTAACQRCQEAIVVEYVRLGSLVRCPHCLYDTVAEVPAGGMIPANGYQLTFRDFRQLLEPGTAAHEVQPLLSAWFGATVGAMHGQPAVLGREGVPTDLMWLHLEIQGNPSRQQELYQLAMTLWR